MRLDSLSDVGSKRKENQDNFWSSILLVDGKEAGVICLCDGMGGLQNGSLASKMVVEGVRNSILAKFDFNDLSNVLNSVNSSIRSLYGEDRKNAMGTTCTVLICYEGRYKVIHIGDSRAYKLTDNDCSLLTVDHSAVKQFNISKKDNPEMWNKYKSKLTRCIGVEMKINPDITEGVYSQGDVFVLCSDGCWHYFEDFTISKSTISNLTLLVRNCMSNGETDNITISVLYI